MIEARFLLVAWWWLGKVHAKGGTAETRCKFPQATGWGTAEYAVHCHICGGLSCLCRSKFELQDCVSPQSFLFSPKPSVSKKILRSCSYEEKTASWQCAPSCRILKPRRENRSGSPSVSCYLKLAVIGGAMAANLLFPWTPCSTVIQGQQVINKTESSQQMSCTLSSPSFRMIGGFLIPSVVWRASRLALVSLDTILTA